MENYSHFIITRFNLNLYAQDKHDLPTRTDRWLEHRFEVFERYCLPVSYTHLDVYKRQSP